MEFEYSEPKKTEKQNNTGIPDNMKKRFEAFSSLSFDDVRVHYNSPEPAKLNALAYTQGTQVYIAPGQGRHLPHELGHVVQQKVGIVPVTSKINGVPVNDSRNMENDADEISRMAQTINSDVEKPVLNKNVSHVVQCYAIATMTGHLDGKSKTVYGKSGNRLGTRAVMEEFPGFYDIFKRVVSPKMLRKEVKICGTIVSDITPSEKRQNVQTEYYKLEEPFKTARRSEQEKDIIKINAEIDKIGGSNMKMWIFSKNDLITVKGNIKEAMERDKSNFINRVLSSWNNYWQNIQSTEYERCDNNIKKVFFMASRTSLKKRKVKIEEDVYINVPHNTQKQYGEWIFLESSYKDLLANFKQKLSIIKICNKNLDDCIIDTLELSLNRTVISKLAFDDLKNKNIGEILMNKIIDKFNELLNPIHEVMQKYSQIISVLENKEHLPFEKQIPLTYDNSGLLKNIQNNDSENVGREDMTIYELRSPYQCAEPNALATLLLFFNNAGINMNINENIAALLDSINVLVNEYGDNVEEQGRKMAPCSVCEQWVERNGRIKDELKNKFRTDG